MKKKVDTKTKDERRHDIRIGFHFLRIGFYLFAREYFKYNTWFVFPGISVDVINGYDRYLDIEAKFLFIGFGFRFIFIKKQSKL